MHLSCTVAHALTRLDSQVPASELNVRPGQPAMVSVAKRTNEDYPDTRSSGGTGHRLGSAVPAATRTNMPGSLPARPSSAASRREREGLVTLSDADLTQPMTRVQIWLADGTR